MSTSAGAANFGNPSSHSQCPTAIGATTRTLPASQLSAQHMLTGGTRQRAGGAAAGVPQRFGRPTLHAPAAPVPPPPTHGTARHPARQVPTGRTAWRHGLCRRHPRQLPQRHPARCPMRHLGAVQRVAPPQPVAAAPPPWQRPSLQQEQALPLPQTRRLHAASQAACCRRCCHSWRHWQKHHQSPWPHPRWMPAASCGAGAVRQPEG